MLEEAEYDKLCRTLTISLSIDTTCIPSVTISDVMKNKPAFSERSMAFELFIDSVVSGIDLRFQNPDTHNCIY